MNVLNDVKVGKWSNNFKCKLADVNKLQDILTLASSIKDTGFQLKYIIFNSFLYYVIFNYPCTSIFNRVTLCNRRFSGLYITSG